MSKYILRNKKISESKRKTIEWFVEGATEAHGNTYDYSMVQYVNAHTKVDIICPEHGIFQQRPHDHVRGKNGCPRCWAARKGKAQSSRAFARFLQEAEKIHDGKYQYHVNTFNGMTKPMTITCPIHGEFRQSPDVHRRPRGCQQCGNGPVSSMSQAWLDSLAIPLDQREVLIRTTHRNFKVDGFDRSTNTVFEFFGDYWHGNPNVYDSADMNTRVGCSFGVLYEGTMQRITELKSAGYKVVYIWEHDFLQSSNNPTLR
jgi:hypothetical protein